MSLVTPRAPRPSKLLFALESRSVGEFGSFFALAPLLLSLLPRGEGQPVLVLPGFLSTDTSTAPLRWLLGRLAPDHVREVVTLGSPIQMEEPGATSTLNPLHDLMRESYSDKVVLPRIPDRALSPLPVPPPQLAHLYPAVPQLSVV